MLTATDRDGRTWCAPLMTDGQWRALRAACHHRRSSILSSPLTGDPVHAKTSKTGLRFFSCFPGGSSGLHEPETMHHIAIKTEIITTARELGHRADAEVPHRGADGRIDWVADTLIQRPGGRPLAIEVQWSHQNDDDYARRTDRYHRDGVDVIWIDRRLNPERVMRRLWDGSYKMDGGGYVPRHERTVDCLRDVEDVLRIPVDDRHTTRAFGTDMTMQGLVTALLAGRIRETVFQPKLLLYRIRCRHCAKPVMTYEPLGDDRHRPDYRDALTWEIDEPVTGFVRSDGRGPWNLKYSDWTAVCPDCGTLMEDDVFYDVYRSFDETGEPVLRHAYAPPDEVVDAYEPPAHAPRAWTLEPPADDGRPDPGAGEHTDGTGEGDAS